MENEIILSLGIYDFEDITHDEITNSLGINPAKIHVKGGKRNPNNPNSPLMKTNDWIMDSGLGKYTSFEDQMNEIIRIIESKIDVFKPLTKKYHCEFSCALFIGYDNGESTPSVHLDSSYNKLLKELNIEFDLDIYMLPLTVRL